MKNLDRTLFGALLLGVIIVLAVMTGRAEAQATHGFDLAWTDPTERTDGMAFDPATEIGVYRAECVRGDDWAAAAFVLITRDETGGDGNERTFYWQDAVQQGGWYNCRINVADTGGLVSDWSATVTVRKLARPNPPNLRGQGNGR
jgi:hypothetical protein